MDEHTRLESQGSNSENSTTGRPGSEPPLRDSEQLFREIVSATSDALAVHGAQGRILFVNDRACEMFGCTREEMLRHSIEDFSSEQPPYTQAGAMDRIQTALNRGTCIFEWQSKRSDGELFWSEVALRACVLAGETRVIASIRDITPRKMAESALWRSEEKFSKIFHHSPNLIAFTEPVHGRIVDVNDTWVHATGISRATAIGQSALELGLWVNSGDRDRCLGELRETGRVRDAELALYARSKPLTFLVSAEFIELNDGPYILWEFRDITDRKRVEMSLGESERRFRELLEKVPLAGVIFDTSGIITFCNDYVLSATGWTREELIGHAITEFVPEARRSSIRDRMKAALSTGLVAQSAEGTILSKSGKQRTLQWCNTLLRDPEGEAVGFASLGLDMTEHRALEERYLQSQKLEGIGRLAGGVAHDFNNLLTVINGYSAMVLSGLPAGDPLRKHLEQILKAGERATDLTQQLLAFSRKQVLKPQLLKLNHVVSEAETMFRRLLGEDINLTTSLDAAPDCVMADSGHIHQVLMNLVVNARDAMPLGGRLTIGTKNVKPETHDLLEDPGEIPGPYVQLFVSDSGSGMDREVLDRIFEPFYTTKKEGQGTGLGLSTVYGIVKQNKGFLRVDSAPGEGSSFHVYLPQAGYEAEAREPALNRTPELHGSATILIVEDEESVRNLAREVLESYGYRVLTAANGGEAMRLSEQLVEPIHLLLTDVVMPGISGRVLADRLQPARPEMRVLFMSGYAGEVMGNRGILQPGLTLLPKPFSPEELAAKVRAVLQATPARRTVLLMDDDAAVRQLLEDVLSPHHNVLVAVDGQAGTELLRQRPEVELVITDLVMPNTDGIEAIQAIRKSHPRIKILAMSGAFGGHFLKTAKMLGADATLQKPIRAEDLRRVVQQLLDRKS